MCLYSCIPTYYMYTILCYMILCNAIIQPSYVILYEAAAPALSEARCLELDSLDEVLEAAESGAHRWNRHPRPQPQTFSKPVSLVEVDKS